MPNPSQVIRTKPVPCCPACGGVAEGLHDGLRDRYFGVPGTWNFSRCTQAECRLVWLNPAPLAEDLYLAYQTYFTHSASGPAGKRTIRDRLYALYRAAVSAPARMTGLYATRQRIEKMCLEEMNPGQLLDVGCGDGTFLNRMRQHGWSVNGIDFDPKAIESAKAKYGLELMTGELHSAGYADNFFDAVTLSHVIEHVTDAAALLKEVWRILKPGGVIVMTTPNPESLGHREFKRYWFGLDAPRHLKLYTVRALKALVTGTGFDVLDAFSTAANADIFIGASISIQEAPGHRSQHLPAPSLARTLKAVRWQYREHASLRHDADCGEEAVIKGVKR